MKRALVILFLSVSVCRGQITVNPVNTLMLTNAYNSLLSILTNALNYRIGTNSNGIARYFMPGRLTNDATMQSNYWSAANVFASNLYLPGTGTNGLLVLQADGLVTNLFGTDEQYVRGDATLARFGWTNLLDRPGNFVTGSGTSNYIPKWDSTGTNLVDSVIMAVDGFVGISREPVTGIPLVVKATNTSSAIVQSWQGSTNNSLALLTKGPDEYPSFALYDPSGTIGVSVSPSGNYFQEAVGIGTQSISNALTVHGDASVSNTFYNPGAGADGYVISTNGGKFMTVAIAAGTTNVEPPIVPGDTNQVWIGNKTWEDFEDLFDWRWNLKPTWPTNWPWLSITNIPANLVTGSGDEFYLSMWDSTGTNLVNSAVMSSNGVIYLTDYDAGKILSTTTGGEVVGINAEWPWLSITNPPDFAYQTNLTAVSNNVYYINTNWFGIPVQAFGAVGDGLTDDITAVQAGVDYVGAAGEKYFLYFPPGTYLLSTTLSIDGITNVVLQGFKATIKSGHGLGATVSVINNAHGVVFDGLTFEGYGGGMYDRGLNITATYGFTIRNCKFQNFNEWALLFGGPTAWLTLSSPNTIENNRFRNCGGGMALTSAEYCHVINNIVTDMGSAYGTNVDGSVMPIVGVGIYGAFGNCRIDNNTVLSNVYGVYLDGNLGSNPDHTSIMGNQINHNQAIGLFIGNVHSAMNIMGNEILSTVGPTTWPPLGACLSLMVYNSDHLTVSGNTIDGGTANYVRLHDVNESSFIGNVVYPTAYYIEVTGCTNNVYFGLSKWNSQSVTHHADSRGYIEWPDGQGRMLIQSATNGWARFDSGYLNQITNLVASDIWPGNFQSGTYAVAGKFGINIVPSTYDLDINGSGNFGTLTSAGFTNSNNAIKLGTHNGWAFLTDGVLGTNAPQTEWPWLSITNIPANLVTGSGDVFYLTMWDSTGTNLVNSGVMSSNGVLYLLDYAAGKILATATGGEVVGVSAEWPWASITNAPDFALVTQLVSETESNTWNNIAIVVGAQSNTWDTVTSKEPAFEKGDLLQGDGISLSGTGTDRLVGAGDITVSVGSHDHAYITGSGTDGYIPKFSGSTTNLANSLLRTGGDYIIPVLNSAYYLGSSTNSFAEVWANNLQFSGYSYGGDYFGGSMSAGGGFFNEVVVTNTVIVTNSVQAGDYKSHLGTSGLDTNTATITVEDGLVTAWTDPGGASGDGDLLEGTGIDFTGTGTDRLVGSGDLTITLGSHGHPASDITQGTFGAGDYRFDGSLIVTNAFTSHTVRATNSIQAGDYKSSDGTLGYTTNTATVVVKNGLITDWVEPSAASGLSGSISDDTIPLGTGTATLEDSCIVQIALGVDVASGLVLENANTPDIATVSGGYSDAQRRLILKGTPLEFTTWGANVAAVLDDDVGTTFTGPIILDGQVPSSSTAVGVTGQLGWNSSYLFICTSGGAEGAATWKRITLETW